MIRLRLVGAKTFWSCMNPINIDDDINMEIEKISKNKNESPEYLYQEIDMSIDTSHSH